MTSCIHFIRHGITQGIVNKWYYGSTDMPLIEEGIEEIQKFKEDSVYPVSDADFYTSGMLRADQTLEVIYGNVSRKAIPNLREMNFGRWECKTFAQLQSEPEYDQWMSCKDNSFVYPEGDSILTFYDRVNKGLDELIGYHRLKELSNRHNGKDSVSIVVCHGGVIAATMERFFPNDKDNFWLWIPKPGRGFSLHLEDGKPTKYEAL